MSKLNDVMGIPDSHPSYGMVGFSRISYGGTGGLHLFGSSIKHRNIIRMRISRANVSRGLSHDWYRADVRPVVEIDLSLTQFAEAITCLNVGDGVPCTLHTVNGEHMAPTPFMSKREQFQNEFAEHCGEVAEKLDDIEAFAKGLMEKPSVTKAERVDLIERIRMLRQQISSNMPFVAKSFNEQMNKTVSEAKGEVEAFVQHRVINAGLVALGAEPLLAIEESR